MTRSRVALCLLTLAALGLRWTGIDFMLPHRLERDGHMVYQARMLAGERDEVASYRGTYPLLMPRIHNAIRSTGNTPLPAAAPLQAHRLQAAADFRRMRRLSAALGCLIVPATFFLARRLVSEGWALLSAALLAFNLLHVSMSQQARPHAAAAALAILAMVACLRMRRAPTLAHCALAGLAVGVALGVLHSGAALVLPLAAAWLLRAPSPRWRGAIPLALVALFAAWCYPTIWVSVDASSGEIVQGSHVVAWEMFDGGGFRPMLWALWSYAPATLVLGLAGLLWALARPLPLRSTDPLGRRDLLVVLAYLLPFLVVFGSYRGFDQRFALPLLPYLACLAALTCERAHGLLARGLRAPAARRAAAAGIALAALSVPTYASVRLVVLRVRPDTIERAAAWLERHLRPDEEPILVMAGLDLPLFQRPQAILRNGALTTEVNQYPHFTSWFRYQREVQRAAAGAVPSGGRWNLVWVVPWWTEFEGDRILLAGEPLEARYAVVERYPAARRNPGQAWIERELRARGELVARFSCYADGRGDGVPLEHEGPHWHSGRHMTRDVLACTSMGPVVEIYRLGPPADTHRGG